MKRIIQFCAILCLLSACGATEKTRGNFLFEEDIRMIQPAISTKNDVLRVLGTPTTQAVFDQNTWYYVGLKTEKESFFDEKVVERQVFKLTFDDLGIVQTIAEVESEAVDVPLTSRVTPTSGNEVTFLQQMLGNIGKFNPPAE
jgi:outer membrane protein assembly factor BamE (lipoprotein component of BamABCDE complex)